MYESLGGPAAIERHTNALREWTFSALSALRHSNGAPLLRIMGRHGAPDARSEQVGGVCRSQCAAALGGPAACRQHPGSPPVHLQGSTLNFQLLSPSGHLHSYRAASAALAEAGFHMRCGCTCNPGACYGAAAECCCPGWGLAAVCGACKSLLAVQPSLEGSSLLSLLQASWG